MIFQFSDGEFWGPIATSLKMWKKINSFIVIIAFTIISEKLNRNPQACPPPPPSPQKNFLYTFFFSPPTRKLAARSLLQGSSKILLKDLAKVSKDLGESLKIPWQDISFKDFLQDFMGIFYYKIYVTTVTRAPLHTKSPWDHQSRLLVSSDHSLFPWLTLGWNNCRSTAKVTVN